MTTLLTLTGLALVAEPTVTQLENHRIRGTIEVQAPADKVRTVLADPRTISRIDNGGTTVTLKGTEANCQLVHSAVVHPIARVEYLTRVCPIAGGWKTTLVKSDHIQDFESVWKVEDKGDRTHILYEIRTIPDIPVPQFVVDRQTRSSVHALLIKLRTHLEAGD